MWENSGEHFFLQRVPIRRKARGGGAWVGDQGCALKVIKGVCSKNVSHQRRRDHLINKKRVRPHQAARP